MISVLDFSILVQMISYKWHRLVSTDYQVESPDCLVALNHQNFLGDWGQGYRYWNPVRTNSMMCRLS